MNTVTKNWILAGIGVAVVAGGVAFVAYRGQVPGPFDAFASCLVEKKVTFYGAFWCPHCQNQKKMFGRSARLLPYVECSTQNGRGQTEACIEKKITNYPTWEFPDGSREVGEVPLATLAEKSGCELPK